MKHSDYRASLEHDPHYIKGKKGLKTKFALGDAILRARLDHGWSQAELAKRVGTKQANISRIEAGTTNPTLDLIHRLLEALDVNIRFTPAREAQSIALYGQVYNDYIGIPVEWPSKSTVASIAINRTYTGYQTAPKTEVLNEKRH